MTELDLALEKYRQDDEQQAAYYDCVLNTNFYLPICEPEKGTKDGHGNNFAPLMLESDGKTYLMLFDNEQRLTEWAKQSAAYSVIAGHVLAQISTPELHWAVNFGSEHAKEFVPEEILWLKEGAR